MKSLQSWRLAMVLVLALLAHECHISTSTASTNRINARVNTSAASSVFAKPRCGKVHR